MKFLFGAALGTAITTMMKSDLQKCAVAFWGKGADENLTRIADSASIQVICNLEMGGTNPAVIEALRRSKSCQVKQHSKLHAKVYIGDRRLIACSANASANGLGYEGRELSAWEEAGIDTDDESAVVAANAWFDSLWTRSEDVKDEDIERSKLAWLRRQIGKPTIKSFLDYEVTQETMPLISPYGRSEWTANTAQLADTSDARLIQKFNDRVQDAVEVFGPDDRTALTTGRWIVRFQLTTKNMPDRRSALSWIQVGNIEEAVYKIEGEQEFKPAAMPSDPQGQQPFVADTMFKEKFFDLISQPSFQSLLEEGPSFSQERLKTILRFWNELRSKLKGNDQSAGPA